MIYDKNGRIIYLEYADGICWKNEYIATGKKVTFTKGDGTVEIYEHDLDGNEISYSNSNGFWTKHEYNSDGDLIYYETCNGVVLNNRDEFVDLTIEEISKKFNIPLSQLRTKK